MVILLVDGNVLAADFIKDGLSGSGFKVEIAHDGLMGKQLFETRNYDLVILDVVLPHLDGFELCRQFRQRRVDVPILILSSRGDTPDKVAGLESGADDYLLKPFHLDELLARIHALLRRKASQAAGGSFTAGDLQVDVYKRTVTRGGKPIQLTSTEFALLVLLIEHKGMVLSRTFISASIWGIDFERRTNLITVYINYLRSKIDREHDTPLILTIIHEGYMLKDPNTP
jgi:two-component system copper resistance phosphate regulon response regulator CusR